MNVGFAPAITVVKSGPASATVGQTVTYTFAVSHAPTSDGSAVTGLTVTDNIAGAATYVSGDTDSDLTLDAGETWNYSATYTIVATDPDPLINTATVTGTDRDGKTIADTDTHSTDLFAHVLSIDDTYVTPSGLNPDGTFSGHATTPGSYPIVIEVCDNGTPELCSTQAVVLQVRSDHLPVTGSDIRLWLKVAVAWTMTRAFIMFAARRRRRRPRTV